MLLLSLARIIIIMKLEMANRVCHQGWPSKKIGIVKIVIRDCQNCQIFDRVIQEKIEIVSNNCQFVTRDDHQEKQGLPNFSITVEFVVRDGIKIQEKQELLSLSLGIVIRDGLPGKVGIVQIKSFQKIFRTVIRNCQNVVAFVFQP